jgi:F0F1-type ATP synthase membrane subunit b/b'
MRRVVSGFVVLAVLWGWGTVAGAFACPTRIEEARGAVQKAEAALDKAKAAAKAAARGPLTKAKEMLSHAEAEHKGAGTDAKKHAEAVREARTAQGYAEEARLIAEHF